MRVMGWGKPRGEVGTHAEQAVRAGTFYRASVFGVSRRRWLAYGDPARALEAVPAWLRRLAKVYPSNPMP